MAPVQFLVRFVTFAAILFVGVAVVNMVVDPYLLFNTPRLSELNARKPAVATQEKLMKGYDAIRRPSKTLILGSSRSDIGLNPLSKSWKVDDQPVYNLSLAGGGLQNIGQYLQHFIASRPLEEQPDTLVIGLDFESFLYRPQAADSKRLNKSKPHRSSLLVLPDGSKNRHRFLQTVKDYATSVLSLDAFLDSMSTITASYNGTGVNLDERGRMDEVAFQKAVELNGIAGLFVQKNKQTVRQFGESELIVSDSADGPVRDIGFIKRYIDIGQTINAKVILFIHPSHADRMEIFDRMGYWDELERWKRSAVALVDAERAAGAQVELWDFAGYESYIQESVPMVDDDDAARLSWFWEPAHYTSDLGDIMIARMRTEDSPHDFGIRLTSENLTERLRQVRADRDRYRINNPSQLDRIRALLCGSNPCQ